MTNISDLFYNSEVSGDINGISTWDIGNVKYISKMFTLSKITGNISSISNWNFSNVEDIGYFTVLTKINKDRIDINSNLYIALCKSKQATVNKKKVLHKN